MIKGKEKVFVGFHMPAEVDELVRLHAYNTGMSVSQAYRLLIQESISGIPTKEKAIKNVIERLKLDWKIGHYANPAMTDKSFCISMGSKLKKKLPKQTVDGIMNNFVQSYDFPK